MVEENRSIGEADIKPQLTKRAQDVEDDFASYDVKKQHIPPEVAAIIPEGWGWFASVMSQSMFNREEMDKGALVISPNATDSRFYSPPGTRLLDTEPGKRASSVFWTTPLRALGDYRTYDPHREKVEVVILAPKQYFMDAGDAVLFKARDNATAFKEGRFPLVATQAVTIDEDRNNRQSTLERYFVVPESFRKEYDQALQKQEESVTHLPQGRLVNPQPEQYVPRRPQSSIGRLVQAATRFLPRIK